MGALTCAKCGTDMVAVQRSKALTGAGMFGALLAIIGALVALAGFLAFWPAAVIGLLLILVGIVMGRGRKSLATVMVCPGCGAEGPQLS